MSNETQLVSTGEFKNALKKGQADGLGIRKYFIADSIEKAPDTDDEDRVLRFTISTGAVDRDGDTINPKGWVLKAFRKNPVVLFAHNGREPPIARAFDIKAEDDALHASAEFMDADLSPFSDTIFRMLKGKFLNATSVGFYPLEWESPDEDEDKGDDARRAPWSLDFKKQELLEFSVVPVPSNPEALVEARSKGIDTRPLFDWYEEVLDQWADYKGCLLVPRKSVEDLHTALKDADKPRKPYRVSRTRQSELLERNLSAVRGEGGEGPAEPAAADEPEGEKTAPAATADTFAAGLAEMWKLDATAFRDAVNTFIGSAGLALVDTKAQETDDDANAEAEAEAGDPPAPEPEAAAAAEAPAEGDSPAPEPAAVAEPEPAPEVVPPAPPGPTADQIQSLTDAIQSLAQQLGTQPAAAPAAPEQPSAAADGEEEEFEILLEDDEPEAETEPQNDNVEQSGLDDAVAAAVAEVLPQVVRELLAEKISAATGKLD